MIFTLMGASLKTSIYDTTTATITNETLTTVSESGEDFATVDFRDVVCVLTTVVNASDGVVINSGNYTQTNCNLLSSGTGAFNNTNWNVTYTYTWEADNTATNVMNDTTNSVGEVTDWFGIFIVISAMVVLILLTVIIITAIRSSGLIAGGSTSGANRVGTA